MAGKATKQTPKKGKPRRDWKPLFLKELARSGVVVHACIKANVGRVAAYGHRDRDEAFAADWDAAIEASVARLEFEVHDRAFDRDDKASHILLMFRLKALKPEMYREPKGDTIVNLPQQAADPAAAKAALKAADES